MFALIRLQIVIGDVDTTLSLTDAGIKKFPLIRLQIVIGDTQLDTINYRLLCFH